ncbi:hypothetical protein ANTPLA_LOCUS5919 [Anthophora plagiata]
MSLEMECQHDAGLKIKEIHTIGSSGRPDPSSLVGFPVPGGAAGAVAPGPAPGACTCAPPPAPGAHKVRGLRGSLTLVSPRDLPPPPRAPRPP